MALVRRHPLITFFVFAVVIVAGPAHLSRKHSKQEEGAAEPEVAAPPGIVKPTPA